VAHEEYAAYTAADFAKLVVDDAVIADVKGMWRTIDLPAGYQRWQL
jgi:UDP-N-acetyl-D-galactosamine dehydrogenase